MYIIYNNCYLYLARFFQPLECSNWEGIEVAKYRRNLSGH